MALKRENKGGESVRKAKEVYVVLSARGRRVKSRMKALSAFAVEAVDAACRQQWSLGQTVGYFPWWPILL